MSWVKENKFVAGLIGVTAVLGGAIIYFGMKQGGAYDEKLQAYEELKGRYSSLQKATPFPNEDNLSAKQKNVAAYQRTIADARGELVKYRPAALPVLSSQQFGDARVKMSDNLRAALAKVELPESTDFGFEKYSSSSPKSEATAQLNYQLGATEWLLTELAAAKPAKLLNISRKPLAVETGVVAEPAGKGKRSKGNRAKAPAVKLYELMPMELSFTASEGAVRQFLEKMAGSDEYFYSIRAVRIRNEKQNPPTQKDADFPAPAPAALGGVQDLFAEFPDITEEEDAAEEVEEQVEPAPVSEQILKQVLGDEKLNVQIIFDVVLFMPQAADAKDKPDAK